jgi:hypothetical protein
MSDVDVDKYRQRAEEALQYAARVIHPLVKEVWLGLAEEWLKLAQSAQPPRLNLSRDLRGTDGLPNS